MQVIDHLHARQILDSRGNPTVEVEVRSGSLMARAAVPSGASTGSHEALELRDKDPTHYHGKSVQQAVHNVLTKIAPVVKGKMPGQQALIDLTMRELDGTENKAKLGANAILGVSMAVCRLAAMQRGVPLWQYIAELSGTAEPTLPRPMMNILNGGVHASNGLSIQECMIVPDMGSFSENLRAGSEIFQSLKQLLHSRSMSTSVGDEGGFSPSVSTVREAFDLITQAITMAGYTTAQVPLAIDAAASEFSRGGHYHIDGQVLSSSELTDYYGQLLADYPLRSIEDSHAEDDIAGFQAMLRAYGDRVQLVGDDLFVTSARRLQQGIDEREANAILIKLNQIGTLTETLQTMELAKKAGFGRIVSHRSGETEDTFIADLAVGTAAGQIKTGSLSRTDRVCKYNQLLRIAEEAS